MIVLATLLGPTIAVVAAAFGTRFLGWFRPRSRRRIAIHRIDDGTVYDGRKPRTLLARLRNKERQ